MTKLAKPAGGSRPVPPSRRPLTQSPRFLRKAFAVRGTAGAACRITKVVQCDRRAPRLAVSSVLNPVSRLVRRTPRHEYGLRFRSEEHTSELQSLMRISYAVFCL